MTADTNPDDYPDLAEWVMRLMAAAQEVRALPLPLTVRVELEHADFKGPFTVAAYRNEAAERVALQRQQEKEKGQVRRDILKLILFEDDFDAMTEEEIKAVSDAVAIVVQVLVRVHRRRAAGRARDEMLASS